MAWKLFWGSIFMMLVKLIWAGQGEYNVNEPYGQNVNKYPFASNQQREQQGFQPFVQSGYKERYDPNNYLPPLTGQEQLQQPGSSNLHYNQPIDGQPFLYSQFHGQKDFPPPVRPSLNALYGQNALPPPGSNQLPTREDFPPPVQPSLNALYGQDALPPPGSNYLPAQEGFPPEVPPSLNALYGQDALPPPGSNQLPIQKDFPPPVPPSLNALYGQDTLPPPGSNQLPTRDDLPPPVPPNLNALYGQDTLLPPGSNQLPIQKDFPPPVPPSLNALNGQDALPPPGSNKFPGADLPPPIPPSLNAFSDQSAVKFPESYQIYGQPPVDPHRQIPYGINDVAPLPNNNQFAPGEWQPPALPDMKKAYGEDALVPADGLYNDKPGDSATNIDNGLKSPSKSMDGYSPDVIIQAPGVKDESYDQEDEGSKPENSDFSSSKSFDESYYYSSILKGLGDADFSSESGDNTYNPLSVGNWIADSDYDSNGEPNQGTAWKPSGTGNSKPKETAGLPPPRTKLRPMGSSSYEDNTPLPNSVALYCIPLVLLLLLLFLIRSNSYFRRTPKVVIVDPESRNRDIDAKAKEIEPLLRESMEYKDEVN